MTPKGLGHSSRDIAPSATTNSSLLAREFDEEVRFTCIYLSQLTHNSTEQTHLEKKRQVQQDQRRNEKSAARTDSMSTVVAEWDKHSRQTLNFETLTDQ
jgi:hypothetical protein